MKADEFITIYKLLTEQSWFSLPFTILAVFGLLEIIFILAKKKMLLYGRRNYVLIYTITLLLSLGFLNYKQDQYEQLRIDALLVKQYVELQEGDYESTTFSSITGYFKNSARNIDSCKLKEIITKFPNDFVFNWYKSPVSGSNSLSLMDKDLSKKALTQRIRLAFVKLKGTLQVGGSKPMGDFFSIDQRLTNNLLEQTCREHPEDFVIEPGSTFNGCIRRIR